ncbi:MAG: DUF1573 domain-containing protein [Bacteroidota bacterium]|jgi:hypothetical protein
MKKIYLMLVAMFLVVVGFCQTTATATTVKDVNTQIAFKNDTYNFGKITFGKPVEYVVEMKNIGKDSLSILNAQPGCGCTTPSFVPNEKFGPGQTVKMTIRFNGSVIGAFTRYTDVYFTGGLTKKFTFSGEGVQEIPATAPATATQKINTKN